MINFRKYRICRRYSPSIGTWYIIQKRIFFWWHTLNISFDELPMANQFLKEMEKEDFCETPLIWNGFKGEYEEIYPCKTYLRRIK